jgi:hypothetical protein
MTRRRVSRLPTTEGANQSGAGLTLPLAFAGSTNRTLDHDQRIRHLPRVEQASIPRVVGWDGQRLNPRVSFARAIEAR